MVYRQTPALLERRRVVTVALNTWSATAPRHHGCGEPVLPAGPGRLLYLRSGKDTPAPNHLWCHGGHDWLEPRDDVVAAARAAWELCAVVVFADRKTGA